MRKHYTLAKAERLKSRKGIEQLFKSGRTFTIYPFRTYYQYEEPDESSVQAGFGVSVKNVKKAVCRNRVKRLMKEAYRTQKNQLQELVLGRKGRLKLFFIYTSRDLPDHILVSGKIDLILQRLVKLIHEIPSSNT
ncbi:MAG: ribonuclease P protein component [Chitinophagaceae bacterium]